MTYKWIDDYCTKKNGCEHDYQVDWEADRYMISGKMFVMVYGDKQGKPIVSVKGDPIENEVLRATYSDIVAGYYMNKVHWNSIYLEGNVPRELILKMIDQSYDLVFKGLSKKTQLAINGQI